MLMELIVIIYSNAEGHDYKKEFGGRWMCLETGQGGFRGHAAVNQTRFSLDNCWGVLWQLSAVSGGGTSFLEWSLGRSPQVCLHLQISVGLKMRIWIHVTGY